MGLAETHVRMRVGMGVMHALCTCVARVVVTIKPLVGWVRDQRTWKIPAPTNTLFNARVYNMLQSRGFSTTWSREFTHTQPL